MNEERVREILSEFIQLDNSLLNGHRYVNWKTDFEDITLDDSFTADELEAIVWWMRNKGENDGKIKE